MREQVVRAIVECLGDLGRELDRADLLSADENTPLLGNKSGLDSIALVTLLVEVEARLSRELGRNIVIADERAMSVTHSPFRRVGTLADYIASLLEQP